MMPSERYTQIGQETVFGIVQRRNTLKSRYLTAAFLYALRGVSYGITRCVLRYNKQGLCVPQKSQSQPKSADFFGGVAPHPPKGEMRMGKDIRIAVRVTAKEKGKIQAKVRKCGLSTSEYVKQRALGYEPRAIPPDALFACLEKLGELADKTSSPELDKEICEVLKQITAEFLLPGKG